MKRSLGEQKIAQILKKERIPFETEKTFSDLKKGRYRYDFYLIKSHILIEYDGEPHFVQSPKFHKKVTDFLKAKERDRQKNQYAIVNKLKLYRIPYWDLEKIQNYEDLFQKKYLVTSIFHNDEIWYEHKKMDVKR